jgi:hypothetical protein
VLLGCWISPCYGPFSLGARYDTYEPFISSIFKFFSGRGKPQIVETTDTESVDMGARLYYDLMQFSGTTDIWSVAVYRKHVQ